MKKIALTQFNYAYGNEYFFPYSAAVLWSYAKFTSGIVREGFDEPEFYFKRDDSNQLITELATFDIVAFSSYVWNWELNKFLAESVKKINDKVIIIFGGPQVPDRAEDFFLIQPYVDVLVHSEGEKSFTNILEKYLSGDLSKLLGSTQEEILQYELTNGVVYGVSFNAKICQAGPVVDADSTECVTDQFLSSGLAAADTGIDQLGLQGQDLGATTGLMHKGITKQTITPLSLLQIAAVGGHSRKWKPWPELMKLDKVPSPYLDETADIILGRNKNIVFQATWETNRGCPYQCTFCDWGSLTLSKIRKFDIERLSQEVEWFSQNKIGFVFGADANFGILERDENIAELLAKFKTLSGFPKKFRVSYAKNSTERVLRIAEKLHSVGMDKGITLSVQSMDTDVLEQIKRRNLKVGDLKKFISEYRRKKIATYTEVIMGLPGETRDSFRDGILKLLYAGVHDALNVYNCGVLPNAQLNAPEEKSLHEIKTIRTPIFMNHSTPNEEKIVEYEEIIISTKTMSEEDWKWMYSFSWVIQSFHTLNVTQLTAIILGKYFGVTYENFYESLLAEAKKSPNSFLGNLYNTFVVGQFEKVFSGLGWGFVLPEFSEIVWSSEEAAFLRVSESREIFFNELKSFILTNFSHPISLLHDPEEFVDNLLKVQKFILLDWKQFTSEIIVKFNVYDCWLGVLNGEDVPLRKSEFLVSKSKTTIEINDKKIFARDIVWFGRKGGKHIYSDIQTNENEYSL